MSNHGAGGVRRRPGTTGVGTCRRPGLIRAIAYMPLTNSMRCQRVEPHATRTSTSVAASFSHDPVNDRSDAPSVLMLSVDENRDPKGGSCMLRTVLNVQISPCATRVTDEPVRHRTGSRLSDPERRPEHVVLSLARAFPDSPVFTSLFEPDDTFPEFKQLDIRPALLDQFAPLSATPSGRSAPANERAV